MDSTYQLFNKVKDGLQPEDLDVRTFNLECAVEILEKEVRKVRQGLHTDRLSLLGAIGEVQIQLWEICSATGTCYNSWMDSVIVKQRIRELKLE